MPTLFYWQTLVLRLLFGRPFFFLIESSNTEYKRFCCCIVGFSYDVSQILCLLLFNKIKYVSGHASFEKNLIRNGELVIVCLI